MENKMFGKFISGRYNVDNINNVDDTKFAYFSEVYYSV